MRAENSARPPSLREYFAIDRAPGAMRGRVAPRHESRTIRTNMRLNDHRRQADYGVVRVRRHVRLPRGQLLWRRSRRQEDAQRIRRGARRCCNHLVIVWDHRGQSFIVSLDAETGQERWRATVKRSTPGPAAGRGRRPCAGDRADDEQGARLRPGNGPLGVGGPGVMNAIPSRWQPTAWCS